MTPHATCVAVDGAGVLILGPSGSGKSALALSLMAMGATLVADDRTTLSASEGTLWAEPPATIAGLIEARGVGLLRVLHLPRAPLHLAVDLSQTETDRLPPQRSVKFMDITLPCLHKVDAPHFAAAIHAYLRGSRAEEP
ncbi:serine kinase [Sulfitobacter albidus]|uniref:Serine kinase n=1 Tax=Sulfitobacter albidus TaxID=2829501 RepID=A0A975PM10_9RHOB|nr:serine kinase [Sulfitobacter albidus]QUJ75740.1 serine kinase [Sulfitobacter albidus]